MGGLMSNDWNQINLDLMEIIQLWTFWTFFWTFYLNHLSPLWGYFWWFSVLFSWQTISLPRQLVVRHLRCTVRTPCRLSLHFPMTIWIFFLAQLKFLHRVSTADSTGIFWPWFCPCPWCLLVLLFFWPVGFFLVLPYGVHWGLGHFLVFLLGGLDRTPPVGMVSLCPLGELGMCTLVLLWDPTRKLLCWSTPWVGGNWIIFSLLWFQSGVCPWLNLLLECYWRFGTYQSRPIAPCLLVNSLMTLSSVLCRSTVGFMAGFVAPGFNVPCPVAATGFVPCTCSGLLTNCLRAPSSMRCASVMALVWTPMPFSVVILLLISGYSVTMHWYWIFNHYWNLSLLIWSRLLFLILSVLLLNWFCLVDLVPSVVNGQLSSLMVSVQLSLFVEKVCFFWLVSTVNVWMHGASNLALLFLR